MRQITTHKWIGFQVALFLPLVSLQKYNKKSLSRYIDRSIDR